jgi:hypothetical protein
MLRWPAIAVCLLGAAPAGVASLTVSCSKGLTYPSVDPVPEPSALTVREEDVEAGQDAGIESEEELKPALEATPVAPSGAKAAPATRVVFGWYPPCSVPVVQDVTKDGHTSRLRMTVVLEKDGDGLRLALRDFRMTYYDGADVSSSPALGPASPVMRAAAVIPEGSIARDGAFRGVPDIDAAAERVAKIFSSSGDPQLQKIAGTMRLPAAKAVMAADLRGLWATWVEAWLQEPFPATEAPRPAKTAIDGHEIRFSEFLVNRGPVRDAPGLLLLSRRGVYSGAMAEQAFKSFAATVLQQADAGPLPADAGAFFAGMRAERSFVAAIDPRNARPARARYEQRLRLGGVEKSEVRDTMFAWDAAVGCERPGP